MRALEFSDETAPGNSDQDNYVVLVEMPDDSLVPVETVRWDHNARNVIIEVSDEAG